MLDILNDYIVEKVSINNGSVEKNILNKYPIYVINLKKDFYRRAYIKFLFEKLQINFNLIIVNNISVYDLDKWKITQRFKHLGQLGCVLSHMWCLRDAINSNYDKFIIFEDDIIFHKRFDKIILKYLDYDYDLLMLGALDFNLKNNINFMNENKDMYFPKELALGAHANLYALNFAKIFYNYKIENDSIIEFDKDYPMFYENYKIGICYPNLVVCELSTTNINHIFSPLKEDFYNNYIDKCFMGEIIYSNYNYILIDFIKFIFEKNILNECKTYEEVIELYIKLRHYQFNKIVKKILTSNDYNLDDLNHINQIVLLEIEINENNK